MQVVSDQYVEPQSETFDWLVGLVCILTAYAIAKVQCKVKTLSEQLVSS
jgi:hypothetical protein